MADKYLSAYYNGNNGNKIYLELHVYTVATSIANNTTTERADLYAVVNDASYGWWNNYGSEAHINVNANTTTKTVNFDYRSTGVKGLISTWDTVIKHDGSGNASIPISAYHNSGIGLGNASVSGTYTCDTIPRYATSNQSLNSKTETTIKMNWSSDNTIDYIWYSTNNGSSWTGVDVTDGKSGTYTISGLSANTTYNIKTRVRRKDSQLTTDSGSLAVKTYSYPTQSLNNKTETTITINWSADSTIDAIYYSINDGSTWTDKISANGTSGSYIISGLSANTSYNIKTCVKRKDTQNLSYTSRLTVATYQYPYVTAIGTNNLVIGNSQTLTLYNPLGRNVNVYMYQHTTGIELHSDSTNSTSITFTPNSDKLYKSIISSQTGKCYYYCEYSGQIKNYVNGNYSINVNANIPTISNGGWGYYDSNQLSRNLTGNNKMLVNNLSNVFVSVSGDAISLKNSATLSSIKATIGDKSVSLNYNRTTNEYTGTIYSINSSAIFVVIVDSRGIQNTYSIDVNNSGLWKNFSKPIFNQVDTSRENGIGTTGLLNLKVNFWNANFGAITNEITKFSYRYKKTTDTSYSSFIDITDRMDLNSNGYYINASDAFLPKTDEGTIATVFEVGYEYNLQFACVDKSEIVVYSDVIILNSGIPCTSKQKNSDGKYSIGVNRLPNENVAFSIDGGLEVDGEGHTNGIVVSKDQPTKNEKIWVQKSKNLIHPIENSNHDYGGVVVTTYKNKIHFEGTSTTGLVYHIPINNIELDGTYTLSITPIGTVGLNYMAMSLDDINQQRISQETSFMAGSQASIVFNATMTAGYLFFFCNAGVTINFDAYIQLEPGSVATTYEEYVDNKISLKNQIGEYEDFVNIDKLKNKIQKNVLVHGYETHTYDVLAGDSSQWTTLHEVAFECKGGLVQINYTSSICNINSLFNLKVYVDVDGVNVGNIIETNSPTVESKTGMLAIKPTAGRHILKINCYNANGTYQYKKIPAFTGCTLLVTEI